LAWFGFNPDAATQTPEAINGVRLLISWIPSIIAIISVVFLFFYPLTTKRMNQIVKELKLTRQED
jgi:GPH family glycoside/pentoside/hexuronide:cation symporter